MRGASLWLVCALGVGCAPAVAALKPESPPLVLNGEAELDCTIDSRSNGRQILTLLSGGGLSLNVEVSPIVDGTVDLKGPKNGGVYRFTSHLAKPGTGELSGVGPVVIESLEARVSVEVTGYAQQAPGQPFTFEAQQMKANGAYVEFEGVVRKIEGNARYAFRLNLAQAREGHGRVEPANSNDRAPIMAKAVVIRSPVTVSVVEKTSIRALP